MRQSEDISKLAEALCSVQSMLHGAKKDSVNPFFKSNYADLESVWSAIREPMTRHGLSVCQTTDVLENGTVVVETTLMHKTGQWKCGILPVISAKPDAQSQGSGMSYARRYGLAAIMGIYQTDDDGESAQGREGEKKQSPSPAKAATKKQPLDTDFLGHMKKAKEVVGGDEYYSCLNFYGYEKSNMVRDKDKDSILNDLRKVAKTQGKKGV